MLKLKSAFLLLSILISSSLICQDTLILKPGPDHGKDARITQTDYATGNSELYMSGMWTYGGVPAKDRSVIEFNLSQLPANIKLEKAYLSLYSHPYGHSQLSGSNESMLYRVTERWMEQEVNWSNQPEFTIENGVYLPASQYNFQDYKDIDVTQLVQDMLDNPDEGHGFMLKMITEEYYRYLIFASSDYNEPEKWPELKIIYIECEVPQATFEYVQDSMTFTFSAPDTNAQSWSWDFGDGYQSVLQNPLHTYAEYATYKVCLTVENECGTDTYCENIDICFPCESSFDFTVQDMTVIFTNQSFNWDSLTWDFGDDSFAFIEDPVHTYTNPGKYNVCLTVTNSCWQHMFCDTLEVYDSQGINDPDSDGIPWVYPNPCGDHLTILLTDNEKCDVSVINPTGKLIIRKEFNDQKKIRLKTGDLPPGIYILTVRSEDKIFRQKIMKGL